MEFGRCRIINPWPEWYNTIHCDEKQMDRQGRAMTYPFDFHIFVEKKIAHFSSTTDIPFYETSLSSCNCYYFQEVKLPCKHMYRLAVELGLIEIISRKHDKAFVKGQLDEIRDSDNVDAHPEQMKRQKSSMDKKCTPMEINHEAKTAVFSGSGKKPYETTIEVCTCRDYFVRRLPCKHIYRLRYEISNAEN